MPLSHHPLIKEFPEHRDAIHRMKMENAHFHRLMDEYEELDKAIYRIEGGEQPTSDEYLEERKKQRVVLKDQIYQMLQSD